MALQGTAQIDALGGAKLIKPLVWMLRNSGKELKFAAMRALHALSVDAACCTYIARVSLCIPCTLESFHPTVYLF